MTTNEHDFHWTCARKALKSALDRLKKTLDPRSTIPLVGQLEVAPDTFSGGAVLRVTDLEAHHSVTLPGTCSGDKLLVDFRQFQKVVDALPEGQVSIRGEALPLPEYESVEETRWVGGAKKTEMVQRLKYQPPANIHGTLGKKTFQLFRWNHTTDGNTLPDAPICPDGFPRTTIMLDLSALLAPVLHAVATDDSRYGLNGAQLEVYTDGSVGAVSTDGHRCVAHRAQLDAKEYEGPLLPLEWCKNLKDIAPGPVTLTWWKPLACGESLNNLVTVDTSRFVESAPLYRVHFDMGGDGKESRTVVRETAKISVLSEVRPKTQQTCTVTTSTETLALLLDSRVSLDDWLVLPDVRVSGDELHLRALYEEIGRSDVVQVEHPDGTVLTMKCLEGDFLDWRQVVPRRFLREATVDRKALDEAVKYVMTVASEKTHCVRVTLRDGAVLLNASNPDEGGLSDEVSAETRGELSTEVVKTKSNTEEVTKETRPFRIGLNGQYLRDELKILGGDKVELRFGDALNPVVLRRPGDDSLMCVVMPMRLE